MVARQTCHKTQKILGIVYFLNLVQFISNYCSTRRNNLLSLCDYKKGIQNIILSNNLFPAISEKKLWLGFEQENNFLKVVDLLLPFFPKKQRLQKTTNLHCVYAGSLAWQIKVRQLTFFFSDLAEDRKVVCKAQRFKLQIC